MTRGGLAVGVVQRITGRVGPVLAAPEVVPTGLTGLLALLALLLRREAGELRRHLVLTLLAVLPLLVLFELLGTLGFLRRLATLHPGLTGLGVEVGAHRRLLATFLGEFVGRLHRFTEVPRELDVLAVEDVVDLDRRHLAENGLQVRTAQCLLLQELGRQGVEVVPVLAQDAVGDDMGLLDEHPDLVVDRRGDGRRVVQGALPGASRERVTLLFAVLHGTELRAHAVLGDHAAGDLRRLLDVGGGTRGRRTEDELLGGASTHGEDQPGEELGAGVHALVVLGHGHGVTAGLAAGEDGDLVDALDVLDAPGGQSVTALVVGGDLLLVLGDDLRGAARATDDAVRRLLQRIAGDDVAVDAGGEQRGLVEHVRQIRTGHSDGPLGQGLQVHVGSQRLVLRVDAQDLLAARQVRVADRDLPVKAARAQQRGVEDVRAVRRGHEDDALTVVEAVHLDEELVEGLLTLIVTAAHAGATLAADGVDLVDEDDAGAVLLRRLEQVAHPRGTDTDEHLDEVRTGDGVERDACLTGDSTGQQRLTGTGRTVEQDATRDLRPELLVAGRVLQEVADLVELLDGLVGAGDVVEGRVRVVDVEFLGLRLADAERTAGTTLHAGEEEQQQTTDDEDRQQHHQQRAEEGVLGDLGLVLPGIRCLDLLEDRVCGAGRVLRDDLLDVVVTVDADLVLQRDLELLLPVIDLHLLDVLVVELLHGDGGVDVGVPAGGVGENAERVDGDEDRGDNRGNPQDLLLSHSLPRVSQGRAG